MKNSISHEELRVGNTYLVKLNDCCITGSFTSTLIAIDWDPGEEDTDIEYATLTFSNGVILECIRAVDFYESE